MPSSAQLKLVASKLMHKPLTDSTKPIIIATTCLGGVCWKKPNDDLAGAGAELGNICYSEILHTMRAIKVPYRLRNKRKDQVSSCQTSWRITKYLKHQNVIYFVKIFYPTKDTQL